MYHEVTFSIDAILLTLLTPFYSSLSTRAQQLQTETDFSTDFCDDNSLNALLCAFAEEIVAGTWMNNKNFYEQLER